MWGMQWEKWKNGGVSIYGKGIEVRLTEGISRGGGFLHSCIASYA